MEFPYFKEQTLHPLQNKIFDDLGERFCFILHSCGKRSGQIAKRMF